MMTKKALTLATLGVGLALALGGVSVTATVHSDGVACGDEKKSTQPAPNPQPKPPSLACGDEKKNTPPQPQPQPKPPSVWSLA